MLASTGQSGCERHDKASVVPKAEARNLTPTATEAFHLQSECVEMGKKVLENNLAHGMEKLDMEQGKMPKDDVTQLAHYNAKDNHCYVELSLHDTGSPMKQAMREVYDGQTGELVASCEIKNPPLGERFGMIFRPERVPESALPALLHFSKEHEEDWSNNQADRCEAYIDYLMERN